jgi:predicted O-methyltransferase YrrM
MKKTAKKIIFIFLDLLFLPLTLISSFWFKFLRKYNTWLYGTVSPISKFIFKKIGVFPIINHYYEPFFYTKKLKKSFREDRNLPGIDMNIENQIKLLDKFNYQEELIQISLLQDSPLNYSFRRGPFLSGDSEILYNLIRYFKPRKIIEIGCGHSSLMIQHGLRKNKELDNIDFKHICIEPYEAGWVKNLDVEFVKTPVEEIEHEMFKTLDSGDILFIDSSHIIRPQGDVLFEYLEILPILKKGVLVHIHDIFSPKDYLDEWLIEGVNFWNEQYLLEAFLSCNSEFKIICATNYLKHNYFELLRSKCPILTNDREPGSFWIQKV